MTILLAFIGLAAGLGVAGGVFALISVIGVIPRIAEKFGIACHTYQMETIIMLGGTLGSIMTVYTPRVPLGVVFLSVSGLFAGIYVGAFAMALAETLKVIPILCMRTRLKHGIAIIVTAIAIGKGLGTLYQMYFLGGGSV
ncbi:MAG: stage V sporulation protein AB [Lachnospiraceae bacterium]|nr:stage V sporulation protein AB [Lachnospiraceae bacterium]